MGRSYATGLTVRPDAVQWCMVAADRGRLEVAGQSSAAVPPPGPEAGEGAASQARTALLREQARSFRGSLAVGLASDQILLRVVRLPTADEAELAGMVELQFDKLSPFPVDQMVFSREILSRADSSSVVLIAGVKAEVVEAIEKEMDGAGALPHRIDASVMAWWQLLLDAGEIREEGRQAILIRQAAGVDLIVAQGRLPAVFRFLGRSPEMSDSAFEDEVVEEVGYTLMSLELEQGPDPRTSFAVWHEDGAAGTLAAKLGEARGCPVETKALSALPSLAEGLARREALPGIGARLDLTPAAWRRAGQSRQFKRQMLVAAEALVGVWILGVLAIMGGTYIEGRKLQHLREQAAALQGPAQEVRDMRDRLRHVNRYMDWEFSAIECLREVTAALPEAGIDLTSMTFKKGENLRVAGEASPGVELVYDLKNKLDASKLFASNTFARAPAAIPGRPKPTFSFEIDMKFRENLP